MPGSTECCRRSCSWPNPQLRASAQDAVSGLQTCEVFECLRCRLEQRNLRLLLRRHGCRGRAGKSTALLEVKQSLQERPQGVGRWPAVSCQKYRRLNATLSKKKHVNCLKRLFFEIGILIIPFCKIEFEKKISQNAKSNWTN